MSNPHEEVDGSAGRPGRRCSTEPVGRARARYWMTLSNLEPVIYGTIVITGVIATAPPEKYSAGAVLGLAAGTVVVFFLAHVYAQVLARAIDHAPRLSLAADAARNSQGMIECLAIPAVALLCGMLNLISDTAAITACRVALRGTIVLLVPGCRRATTSRLAALVARRMCFRRVGRGHRCIEDRSALKPDPQFLWGELGPASTGPLLNPRRVGVAPALTAHVATRLAGPIGRPARRRCHRSSGRAVAPQPNPPSRTAPAASPLPHGPR